MSDDVIDITAWHLVDATGTALFEGHGMPMTVGGLSQALCLAPEAVAVVSTDGATLLATEAAFKQGGFHGLENRPTKFAEMDAEGMKAWQQALAAGGLQ